MSRIIRVIPDGFAISSKVLLQHFALSNREFEVSGFLRFRHGGGMEEGMEEDPSDLATAMTQFRGRLSLVSLPAN